MEKQIPLTKMQKEIMQEFYSVDATRVVMNKNERNALWKKVVKREDIANLDEIQKVCPAIFHQIKRSYEGINNVQSAVFSECAYAQTLANMTGLKEFINCYDDPNFVPEQVANLLKSYFLTPRYIYANEDASRMLIQAGGCNGIDSALITVIDLNIYTIEFKEAGSKTSEPDLPKYGEDGILLVTENFLEVYPQFQLMLEEQQGLNFFDNLGKNIHNFSVESVSIAVSNNYTKKYADVVCTEDTKGLLVMLPINQISKWASIEGEIRPAGRNSYKVWTPLALEKAIYELGGKIINREVIVEESRLRARKPRGGDGSLSGYKINSLFFVRTQHCVKENNMITFNINHVRQLNPTVAGKMFFKNLKHGDVKEFYDLK